MTPNRDHPDLVQRPRPTSSKQARLGLSMRPRPLVPISTIGDEVAEPSSSSSPHLVLDGPVTLASALASMLAANPKLVAGLATRQQTSQ